MLVNAAWAAKPRLAPTKPAASGNALASPAGLAQKMPLPCLKTEIFLTVRH